MSARAVRKVVGRRRGYAKQELQMLQIGFPITQHFNANSEGAAEGVWWQGTCRLWGYGATGLLRQRLAGRCVSGERWGNVTVNGEPVEESN